MTRATIRETLNITAEPATLEIHEVEDGTTHLVTHDGYHLLALNDTDLNNLITTLTTVWRHNQTKETQ